MQIHVSAILSIGKQILVIFGVTSLGSTSVTKRAWGILCALGPTSLTNVRCGSLAESDTLCQLSPSPHRSKQAHSQPRNPRTVRSASFSRCPPLSPISVPLITSNYISPHASLALPRYLATEASQPMTRRKILAA